MFKLIDSIGAAVWRLTDSSTLLMQHDDECRRKIKANWTLRSNLDLLKLTVDLFEDSAGLVSLL